MRIDDQTGMRIYEPDGATLARYLESTAPISIIRGPIGSGTSSASCMKIFKFAMDQRPSPVDGKRRSKWCVIRDSYPNLENTTIETWLHWFPEELYGKFYWSRPFKHEIRVGDIELDVLFLAMEGPEDLKKLRSFELTGVFFNEMEFAKKFIFDEAESRTKRYPSKEMGGSNWFGMIGDMNAPPPDHWLPQMTGEAPPADDLTEDELARLVWPVEWEYLVQPPAVLEIRSPDGESVVGYETNPAGENIHNLVDGYYEKTMRGKSKDWIDSRLRNKIVHVVDGDPVWKQYNADKHLARLELRAIPGHDLWCGLDFGLRPAALIAQNINNRVFFLKEFRKYGATSVTFAPELKRFLERNYPGYRIRFVGDPKGQDRHQSSDRTSYDVFKEHGMIVMPAPVKNNDIATRLAAIDSLLSTMHNGMPRYNLSPIGCPTLVAAMAGRYHIKKGALGDADPVKDKFSDIADCSQYIALALGEGRRMIGLEVLGGHGSARVSKGLGGGLLGRRKLG